MEAIEALRAQSPVSVLQLSYGLTLAARDHCADIGLVNAHLYIYTYIYIYIVHQNNGGMAIFFVRVICRRLRVVTTEATRARLVAEPKGTELGV